MTGKQNHPAPPEATGLEVDKLDPVAWELYVRTYLDMYKNASGGQMGEKGIQYILTDSYEAECETWTPAMYEEFAKRRGYDLTAWMPVLAGEVIGSPAQSDAFLFDWRTTLNDLIADNYTLMSKIAREDYGMLGRYTEAHEAGRAFVGDGMDLKATAEVPMGAMWIDASWLAHTPDGGVDRSVYDADDKESSSVAHIYGQNIAAAESMTVMVNNPVAYSYHPGNLKFLADIELANGINRIVIHESASQPDDVHVPGLSLGGVGQWFNRHETWAEMARAWADYMARSCFMLQAGQNVADILWYYGEDSCVTTEFGRKPANIPVGFQWDYCSPNALLQQISAKDGRLVSRSGVSYQVLFMDRNVDYMSVPVLRQLAALAKAGVWIGGAKPKYPASLSDDPAEFDRLVAEIWGGKYGNVLLTDSLAELLKAADVQPDAMVSEEMKFLHRALPSAEVYWINKPSMDYEKVSVSFRTTGLKPQVWHPDTGVVEDVSYRVENGRTVVDLDFVPDDAVFVVFAGRGEALQVLPDRTEQTLLTIEGPWEVKFQQGRGAPAGATFETLQSYTDSSDPGIKYFSGVATYARTLSVPAVEGQTFLDLGCVKEMAEVYVNGRFCGTAWKEPFRVDVSQALREGGNALEIRVANTWPNRLIGDEQPGAKRITFTDAPSYRAEDPLRAGGLLGPLRIVCVK
uniref:Glycoside hydrolase family 2 n=1 Tax=uncultured bacterium Contig1514 TaxID=1393445 RepID=W0FNJ3_9BACT|nr:glycoside hydrolase family 2 [uncultured bacterium Contig1514]